MLAVVATWPYLYSMMTGMKMWSNKPALKGKWPFSQHSLRPALVNRAIMWILVYMSASLLDVVTLGA